MLCPQFPLVTSECAHGIFMTAKLGFEIIAAEAFTQEMKAF